MKSAKRVVGVTPNARQHFTWLHLSDWHQGLPDFDRSVLLKRMLDDISDRRKHDPRLENIDLVIFSGDIAYSGQQTEYTAAQNDLIEPIKRLLDKDTSFIFAPGNHDLDRKKIADIPSEWDKVILSRDSERQKKIGDLLYDKKKVGMVLAPFDNFYSFSADNDCRYSERDLVYSKTFKKGQVTVGIATINTAICCDRNVLRPKSAKDDGQSWDYGTLSISERQIRDAINRIANSQIRILVMHHPISWMHESEQAILEQLIASNFDLVLYGHEHLPRFNSVSGNFGEIKFVPAGSAYAARLAGDPRYTNAFNFGVVDTKTGEGAIHHRRWLEERDEWDCDERYWPEGTARFLAKRDLLPQCRKYVYEAQKRYKKFHSLRPAKKAEITVKHTPYAVGGEQFVLSTVRYRMQLYPGPAEKFPFRTLSSKRILKHRKKDIRNQAFKIISMKPKPEPIKKDKSDASTTFGVVNLPAGDANIEYHYQMLECEDGVWYFSLGRFIDHVRIVIEKAPGYDYEFLPLGGFPNLHPGPDGVLSFESIESDAGHLPYQGYLVQWYPAK